MAATLARTASARCTGKARRSVHQFEILPRPPDTRAPDNPWPQWSMVYRTSSAHEEGGERVFSVNTECFLGDEAGNVRALLAHEVEMRDGRFEKVEGSDFELPCELVLLAMGFIGPERGPMLDQLGVALDARGNVDRDAEFQTSVEGVFACGDMGRGQSLIVWAIAEGRSCAASVDQWLMGESTLPAPILPTTRPSAERRNRSVRDERVGLEVVHVVERAQRTNAVRGEHDADGRMRGAEEHVVRNADDVADVGVDHAAVARDHDPLPGVSREDAFDRVDRALAEVEARL